MRTASSWPTVLLLAACAGPSSAVADPADAADPAARFAADGMRTFARVACADGWLVVGGQPAREGIAAVYGPRGERRAWRRLGDDVACAAAVDAGGGRAAIGMTDGRVLVLGLPALEPTVLGWQHARPAVAVAFAPGGELLASAGLDGVVRIGAPGQHAPHSLEHTAAATCLGWSADGALLASGARDGKVRVSDARGRLLRTWNRLGGEVVGVAFRGRRIVCRVRASPLEPPFERELGEP